MPQTVCPNCKERLAYDKTNPEFYHQCSTGNNALDRTTVLNLDAGNWNLQGLGTKVGGMAEVLGHDVDDVDERGFRKSTTKTIPTIIAIEAEPRQRQSNVRRHPR